MTSIPVRSYTRVKAGTRRSDAFVATTIKLHREVTERVIEQRITHHEFEDDLIRAAMELEDRDG
jgi:hypothetical protein